MVITCYPLYYRLIINLYVNNHDTYDKKMKCNRIQEKCMYSGLSLS